MSERDKSPIDMSALTDRLKRDLDAGTRTAKVVWKSTVQPGLRDISKLVRERGERASEQAGEVFVGLGRRLRGLRGRIKNR